ncbi:MAG: hypothetical protein JXQ65_00965 [Candidatus Marinimicrobia bacterium]|nr:hypothetical protein [Candidatus Neomarinimicrobiota bacterium]
MKYLILILTCLLLVACSGRQEATLYPPTLTINGSNNHEFARAYRIAIGDLTTNIQKYQAGLLNQPKPCILAGLVYDTPWTRDASINTWNAAGLLFPSAAKHTLLAQVTTDESGQNIIDGQYWDKIVWGIGAWNYYLYNHDRPFLKFSHNVIKNTLEILETTELDKTLQLFRGPAVYGDGVAAYPLYYTSAADPEKEASYSAILDWIDNNPDKLAIIGKGLPMMTLSTNCVYAEVYKIMHEIEEVLSLSKQTDWLQKSNSLQQSIKKNFWNEERKSFNYLIDPQGHCDYQEGMGLAYAILFDIADSDQKSKIFQNIHLEPAGIPCVYPSFPRYKKTKDAYGRHSGTVWPHIQGFWADACIKNDNIDGFLHEFRNLAKHAVRDNQFVEIYHPVTGLPYGGLQEPWLDQETIWFCAERQTWSATAYLRMILLNIIGMEFKVDGIEFHPFLPEEFSRLEFGDLHYGDQVINIQISGKGNHLESFQVNGMEQKNFLPYSKRGQNMIEMIVSEKYE